MKSSVALNSEFLQAGLSFLGIVCTRYMNLIHAGKN